MQTTREINKLLFILDGYPYGGSRSCVFVRNMIVAMADMGVDCTVIAPQIITPSNIRSRQIPYFHEDVTDSGNKILVYAPRYVYYPGKLSFVKGSMDNHYRAVLKTIKKEKINADAVYGHFIFQCGLTAARIGEKMNIPSYLGAGESDKLMMGNKRCNGVYENGVKNYNWRAILDKLTGVVCVSEWTKKLLFENNFLSLDMEDKLEVFINGVNKKIFHIADKDKAREKLSMPKEDFIVSFVGAFNCNKGVERLAQAIDVVDGAKAVFLGSGELTPESKKILFKGSCSNEKVAQYLQASDCFALPTKSEGCCNAILEALSCGLPVISSDLPFNDGILDDSNSIRIDPENIGQLADAIKKLKEDVNFRMSLAKGAEKASENYSIEDRARRILAFMRR